MDFTVEPEDKVDILETIRHCLPKSMLQNTNCGKATSERALWSMKFEMLHSVSPFRDFNVLTHTKCSENSCDNKSPCKFQISCEPLCVCGGVTPINIL